MTETEGKCEHGRNLVRTYCPCFILRITMDKLLASQKSALLAKVLEELNSGRINEDMFAWLCKLAEQEMLPASSAVVEQTIKFAKKRISEELA